MDNLRNNRSEIERLYRDQIRKDGLKPLSVNLKDMVSDYQELIEQFENTHNRN